MKKTTIDFDFKFSGLDGIIGEQAGHAGEVAAMHLSADKDPSHYLKYFTWALELYNKRPIELDDSDLKIFKSWIESGEKFTTLARAQMMKTIQDAEDANKKATDKDK